MNACEVFTFRSHSAYQSVFILFLVTLVLTGCGNRAPQHIVNKSVAIEQGDYFSHSFRLNREATLELTVESQNMPVKMFISSKKDAPAAAAGLPVNVWFLSTEIYRDSKSGKFPQGDYTLFVKHGKEKGFFDDPSPAARVNILLSGR